MADAAVVDIHTHTFNADDIPVKGFIHRLHLRKVPVGAQLAQLVDALIQNAAPSFEAEKAKLDGLLARHQLQEEFGLEVTTPQTVRPAFEQEVDAALSDLQLRDPIALEQVAREISAIEGSDAVEIEGGLWNIMDTARRVVRWIKLYGLARLDLTRLLIENFDDEVDLFCPMLVDLSAGLGDVAKTTMLQQIQLHEKISRLSMLERIPGVSRARVHPFVGFDPRLEVKARIVGEIHGPLDVVRSAIDDYGFVGVKLYPPMGFRPIGNTESVGMPAKTAERVDKVLTEFYEWCQENNVPITAHCNISNFAHKQFERFASPENWIAVLERYPDLHVNLGHFGGTRDVAKADGWPVQIARAVDKFEHLYADVGNHNVHDDKIARAYLDGLSAMFEDSGSAVMKDRVMYGSDWYMVALHPEHDEFLKRYRSLYLSYFGEDATESFMGKTALRFLGFDSPSNLNAQRLRKRYEKFSIDEVPAWLAPS